MEIRKTTLQDVDTVLDVFAAAKRYMRANGNASQWGDEYPDRSIVTYDIACGSSYVMLENGEIVGTFALFLGEDESYRVIEDGAWHLDQPYGTIHRLASNGKARGVSRACFDFCTAQIGYLRADTHADNRPMQRLLEAYGFRRCGVIHGAVDGEIVKLAREQHIPKLHAEIYSFNAQSQRMFERAGFHKAGDELYEMEL